MTAETIIQSLASGLLMGLLYGLISVGLALIFGLMDVVNFAHGEFLMIAMYATFFLFAFFALDPLLSAPLVAAALFLFGAVVYLLVVRFAVRAKANAGMVQIFSTFGLAIVMRGFAQFFFTPDYRSVTHSWLGGKTVSIAGIFLPVPQLVGALVSPVAMLSFTNTGIPWRGPRTNPRRRSLSRRAAIETAVGFLWMTARSSGLREAIRLK